MSSSIKRGCDDILYLKGQLRFTNFLFPAPPKKSTLWLLFNTITLEHKERWPSYFTLRPQTELMKLILETVLTGLDLLLYRLVKRVGFAASLQHHPQLKKCCKNKNLQTPIFFCVI